MPSSNQPEQISEITKVHTMLNQLTPALELKILGSYAITIPFSYITNFEYSVNDNQAHIELFDSSFYIIDTFAFILAKLSQKGIPTKIKWGYAYNSPTPTITNERVQVAQQAFYMSKEHNFVLRQVESKPDEKGSRVTMHFIVDTFDPVLTSIPVNKTFVSNDLASITSNASSMDALINKWSAGSAEEKARAKTLEASIKKLKDIAATNPANEEALRTQVQAAFGAGAELVKGKLTFGSIYFNLMKIADKNQNIGGVRESKWEIPFPVFPPEYDENYDYLIFTGDGNNVETNILKLASMMRSTPQTTNYAQTGQTATPNVAPRNVMIGGKRTYHSARLDKQITGSKIYASETQRINVDTIPSNRVAFCVWAFNEATYEIEVTEEPVAFFRYHAGEPGNFNKNNLTEVLEFSVEANSMTDYFMMNNLFALQNVTNQRTGVTTDVRNVDPISTADIAARNQGQITTGNTAALNGSAAMAGVTNPSIDNNTGNAQSSVSSPVDTSAQKHFEVFGQVNPARDADSLKEFIDAIRSQAKNQLSGFGAEMTILGDPKWDGLSFLYNKSIYFEYVNKNGDVNPIFTGTYCIINIKHSISSGKFTTSFSMKKVPEKSASTSTTENSHLSATTTQGFGGAPTTAGEPITNAQISITVSKNNNRNWKVQDVFSYKGSEYKDSARVDTLLTATISQKVKEGAQRVVDSVQVDTFEELERQVKSRLADVEVTKQNNLDIQTKFMIYELKKL